MCVSDNLLDLVRYICPSFSFQTLLVTSPSPRLQPQHRCKYNVILTCFSYYECIYDIFW